MMSTTRARTWMATAAVVGLTAWALAACLLWLLLTRPVELADTLARLV